MTLSDFESDIFETASASPVCGIPFVRRRMPVSVSLRVPLTIGGFVEAFCNEETGTVAFAMIQDDKRVFGADNTGGWHLHPFDDPEQHLTISAPMTFAALIAAIERFVSSTQ